MLYVAAGALLVDLLTAALMYRGSKESLNIRAAFLHNLMDALASLGVILAALLIMIFGWMWIDALMTLTIAGFILYHGFKAFPDVVNILMEGVPKEIDVQAVINAISADPEVENVHNVHIWQLDEHRAALQAHVLICGDPADLDTLKKRLKDVLLDRFAISHSTLEFELTHCKD